MDNKPAVTIVYSWDGTEHQEWVKNLATELESNGVEVTYDQNNLSLGDDLNQFMELAVDSASIILAVCSEEYKKKIDNRDGGSGYEGRMIAEKVKDKSATVIPIIRTKYSSEIIPSAFRGINCADLSAGFEANEFGKLLGKIHGYDVKKRTVQKNPKETIAKTLGVNLSEIKNSNEMNLIDLKIMNIVADKITLPKMDGSAGSALYKIPFRLNASPPSKWASYLIHFWDHPTSYTTMHRPGIAAVRGDCIWLEGTTLEEVKKYHKTILEEAIVRANNAYNDEIEKDEQSRILKEQKKRDLINNINNELKDINF